MKNIAIVILFAVSLFAAQTQKITDSFGREVEIPKDVKKIVALNSSLRLIVYMDAQSLLVGTENIENRDQDRRPYTSAIKNQVKGMKLVGEGGPGKPTDIEAIISLKPDVIFSSFFLTKDTLDNFSKQVGIPVVGLAYFDASGLGFDEGEFFKSLEILGKVFGKEERANELTTYIKTLNSDLAQRVSKIKEKKSAYIGAVAFKGQHGIASTEAAFFPFDKAGAKNVVDGLGKKGHLFLEKEKLLELQPQVLFIDGGGFDMVKDDVAKNGDFYKNLQAFKSGEIYKSLPNTFYGANIEIMYANTYFTGKSLYPEAFGDIEPKNKADEIIKKFVKGASFDAINEVYDGYKRVSFE